MDKGVEAEIASFENEFSVDIDWISTEDILPPANNVMSLEAHFVIWGFGLHFDGKGVLKFTKVFDLMELEERPMAIKRVAYQ